MTRVLVVGYGNPLRGDDGLGWQAARILAETEVGKGVEVLACRQLTPDLSEQVSLAELVIFIDVSDQDPPGQLCCRPLTAVDAPTRAFSHDLTPAALLQWARELYGATPACLLISVGAETFAFGEGLSQTVARSLPALLACVREKIRASEGSQDEKP